MTDDIKNDTHTGAKPPIFHPEPDPDPDDVCWAASVSVTSESLNDYTFLSENLSSVEDAALIS